jgi:hypothetical protein
MMYKDKNYITFVNKTYSKAFSKKQMLPKFVASQLLGISDVLDYGAGKDAYGSQIIRDMKKLWHVTSYEIGDNVIDGIHDTMALSKKYDVVMMSNVINIQPSLEDVIDVLIEVKDCMRDVAYLYCNLPESPRKSSIDEKYLTIFLKGLFPVVTYYGNGIFESGKYVRQV